MLLFTSFEPNWNRRGIALLDEDVWTFDRHVLVVIYLHHHNGTWHYYLTDQCFELSDIFVHDKWPNFYIKKIKKQNGDFFF